MKFGTKVTIAFAVGLLSTGVIGIRSYLAIVRLTETNRGVIHAHEVLENLEQVRAVLTEADAGQRSFVLTGEERYLEPYQAAAGAVQRHLDALVSLTHAHAASLAGLQQLRTLARDHLEQLQPAITQRREAGLESARSALRTGPSDGTSIEIRALINRLAADERQALEARNRAAAAVAQRTIVTLGFGVLLSLVVLGGAAVLVTRTMQVGDRHTPPGGAGRSWVRPVIQYGFAFAMVAVTTGLRWWLVQHVGPMPTFITWYPAVLLVASLGGGGPGILTTLLAALAADYWFIPPPGGWGIAHANDAVALGIFVGTGIFLSLLAERLRRARWGEAVSVTQGQELALLNLGNLMTLDLDHRILSWSEGNHRLYGFTAAQAQGQLAFELLGTRLARPLEEVQRELLAKGIWEGEAARRRQDGTPLSVAILWALRRDEQGQPLAILEASTDITARKHAEEALRASNAALARFNDAAVGRELRVIELKQQVNELCAQLGQPRRYPLEFEELTE